MPPEKRLVGTDQSLLWVCDVDSANRPRRQIHFPITCAARCGVGVDELFGGLAIAPVEIGLFEGKNQVSASRVCDVLLTVAQGGNQLLLPRVERRVVDEEHLLTHL